MKSYILPLLLLVVFSACKSTENPTQANPNSSAASTPTPAAMGNPPTSTTNSPSAVKSEIDVCNLLSSDDLKSVQGEAFKEAQRSDREDNGLVVAQCYYQLPTMANSVVLNLTTPKRGGGALNPRGFWEQTFHKTIDHNQREGERTKEKADRDRDEKEEGLPPERVKSLGQEAFWLPSRVGGALYVKRDDFLFFRISVGGADNAPTKLNKSKRLAQLVLKKLGPSVPEG